MITPIDVVDSAVKIGLGALISGVATYWLAKANHDKTIAKERAQRKRDMLELVAEHVATFDQAAYKYWAATINWLLSKPAKGLMSQEKHDELMALVGEFFDSEREIGNAEAKLLLLGEIECHRLLRDYEASVEITRPEGMTAGAVSVEGLKEYRQRLKQKHQAFFAELSEVYRKIQ